MDQDAQEVTSDTFLCLAAACQKKDELIDEKHRIHVSSMQHQRNFAKKYDRRSVRLIHRCVLCNTDCHSLVAYFEHVKSRGHAVCVNQCSVSINRKEKKQNLKSKAAALEHKIASLLIHSNVSDMPAASLDHLQSRQQQSDLTMHGGHQHQPDGAVFGQTRSDNSSSAHACHADGHHSIRRSRRRPSSHRATGANTEPPAISRQPAMSSGAVSTSSGLDRTSSVSEFSNMSAVASSGGGGGTAASAVSELPAGVPVRAVTPTGLTSRLLQCQAVLPDNVQCGGVVEKGSHYCKFHTMSRPPSRSSAVAAEVVFEEGMDDSDALCADADREEREMLGIVNDRKRKSTDDHPVAAKRLSVGSSVHTGALCAAGGVPLRSLREGTVSPGSLTIADGTSGAGDRRLSRLAANEKELVEQRRLTAIREVTMVKEMSRLSAELMRTREMYTQIDGKLWEIDLQRQEILKEMAALSKVSVGETTAGSHASELTSPPQGMAQNSSNPLPPLSTSQRDVTLQSSQLRSNSSSSLPANMPVCTAATTGTASASSDRVMASGDNRSSKVATDAQTGHISRIKQEKASSPLKKMPASGSSLDNQPAARPDAASVKRSSCQDQDPKLDTSRSRVDSSAVALNGKNSSSTASSSGTPSSQPKKVTRSDSSAVVSNSRNPMPVNSSGRPSSSVASSSRPPSSERTEVTRSDSSAVVSSTRHSTPVSSRSRFSSPSSGRPSPVASSSRPSSGEATEVTNSDSSAVVSKSRFSSPVALSGRPSSSVASSSRSSSSERTEVTKSDSSAVVSNSRNSTPVISKSRLSSPVALNGRPSSSVASSSGTSSSEPTEVTRSDSSAVALTSRNSATVGSSSRHSLSVASSGRPHSGQPAELTRDGSDKTGEADKHSLPDSCREKDLTSHQSGLSSANQWREPRPLLARHYPRYYRPILPATTSPSMVSSTSVTKPAGAGILGRPASVSGSTSASRSAAKPFVSDTSKQRSSSPAGPPSNCNDARPLLSLPLLESQLKSRSPTSAGSGSQTPSGVHHLQPAQLVLSPVTPPAGSPMQPAAGLQDYRSPLQQSAVSLASLPSTERLRAIVQATGSCKMVSTEVTAVTDTSSSTLSVTSSVAQIAPAPDVALPSRPFLSADKTATTLQQLQGTSQSSSVRLDEKPQLSPQPTSSRPNLQGAAKKAFCGRLTAVPKCSVPEVILSTQHPQSSAAPSMPVKPATSASHSAGLQHCALTNVASALAVASTTTSGPIPLRPPIMTTSTSSHNSRSSTLSPQHSSQKSLVDTMKTESPLFPTAISHPPSSNPGQSLVALKGSGRDPARTAGVTPSIGSSAAPSTAGANTKQVGKSVAVSDVNQFKVGRKEGAHTGAIVAIKYFGGLLFTCSEDKTCHSFDKKTLNSVKSFEGHRLGINCIEVVEVAKEPKTVYLLTGSNDANMRVYDAKSAELLIQYKLDSRVMCMLVGHGKVFAGRMDGKVSCFREEVSLAKEDHAPVQDYVFHDSCVSSMCFANIDNEPAIVSGCFSGQIAVRSTHSLSGPPRLTISKDVSREVLCLQAMGLELYCGGTDHYVRVYNLKTGAQLRQVQHDEAVSSLVVVNSKRRTVLFTSCLEQDGYVRLYNAKSLEPLVMFGGEYNRPCSLCLVSNALIVGCRDGMIFTHLIKISGYFRCLWRGCEASMPCGDKATLCRHLRKHCAVLKACRWDSCNENLESLDRKAALEHVQTHLSSARPIQQPNAKAAVNDK